MTKKWNSVVLAAVIIALLLLIFETTPFVYSNYHQLLVFIDGIITLIFCIDFYFKFKIASLGYKSNSKISNFINFELAIDLLSILPFFIAFFTPSLKIITVLRLLRLLRIFKLMNLVKSNSLIINAIKNKRYELYISMQVVLIITFILSAILYFVENSSQPENFSSIADAFFWSISKFIGEIGGFGDFAPITVSGKVLATLVGILGIAIFAVPAGIIASGFVEEIESVKKNTELTEVYTTLSKAFQFDILSGQRAKAKVGLAHTRRRFISIVDAIVKLNKSEADIFEVCGLNQNLKLTKRLKKSGDEEVLIEYFENNSIYGTLINRKSRITIISPHSNDGFNLGHYSYCLAEELNANYVSVEKYGIYSFLEETNINFNENDNYLKTLTSVDNEVVNQFMQDLNEIIHKGSFVCNIGSSMGDSPSFHLLTGGAKDETGICPAGTCSDIEYAKKIYTHLDEKSKENGLTVTTHSHYSTQMPNHLDWFISKELNANAISIKVNVELMKGSNEKYYESIGILTASITASLL